MDSVTTAVVKALLGQAELDGLCTPGTGVMQYRLPSDRYVEIPFVEGLATEATVHDWSENAHGRSGGPGSQSSASRARLAAAIAEANPLRYAGYCYDGFSGLYYCSQRYYDPAAASFITKDPAKADGEGSAYQYCGGDPVGRVDPSGEWDMNTFHRDVSRCVAAHLGVKKKYSDLIAAGAREVDTRLYLTSIPGSPSYGLHFNIWLPVWKRALTPDAAYYKPDASDSRMYFSYEIRRLAEADAKSGRYEAAARKLGWGLHPLQDAYAHGNLVQHLGWKKCDSTGWRSPWETKLGKPKGWRASMATYATKAYLQGFKYLARLK